MSFEDMLYVNMCLTKYFRFTIKDIEDMDWITYTYYIKELNKYLEEKKKSYDFSEELV